MRHFKDKVVWIVGATSGIGRATAYALHKEGATVVLSARRAEGLKEICKDLGERAFSHPLDVIDLSKLSAAISAIKKKHGHIDSALYFPAFYKPGPIKKMLLDDVQKMLQINLLSGLIFAKEVSAFMESQGGGQIGLCGSVAGYVGLPDGQPYSATKAGLINFTESLKLEHPNLDIKIINPGFVKTPMTDKNKFTMPLIVSPRKSRFLYSQRAQEKTF